MKNLRESVSNLKQLIHRYTGNFYSIMFVNHSQEWPTLPCRSAVMLKISFGKCKLQVRNYKPDACAKPSACKCI